MTEPIPDAERVITNAPIGSMIKARVTLAGVAQTAYLIREDRKRIDRLGESLFVVIRTGLIVERGVHLVPVLLSIENGPPYECWFNYHQAGDGRDYFNDLSTQERIPILIYASKIARRLTVPNYLGPLFANYAAAMPAQPWTMQAFNAARNLVYARYPEVNDLWDELDCE